MLIKIDKCINLRNYSFQDGEGKPKESKVEGTEILSGGTEKLMKTDSRRTRNNSVCISDVSSLIQLNKTVDLMVDSLTPAITTNNITDQADVQTTASSSPSKTKGNLSKYVITKVITIRFP